MVPPPFAVGRPAWIDDPHFDPDRHLRTTTLPPPGGRDQLRRFIREVLETRLDPDRPLWELWVVDGVEGGRIAVLLKFSHLAVDGIALLTFALSLLDDHPRRQPRRSTQPWVPAPAPGAVRLFGEALVEDARRRVATLAGVAGVVARPGRLALRATRTVRAAHGMLVPAPRLPITGVVGRRRDFAWVSLPIQDLRDAAHAHGATLNDVVLAIVADAVAVQLARADTRQDTGSARALVPVSTHVSDGGMTNSFSLMVTSLPVGDMSVAARVDAVHAQTQRAKSSGQIEFGPMLFQIESLIPPALLRAVVPPLLRRQPFVNLAVTNLAGSPVPLYLLGSRLLEVYPFITLTGNIGMIVGALSHDHQLGVSVTVDPDLGVDVEAFTRDIESAAAAFADFTPRAYERGGAAYTL
jgi:WS/DGAT/MGAT family acyltransferase